VQRIASRAAVGAVALGAVSMVAPLPQIPTVSAESKSTIPFTGVPGSPHERTFVAIKPDGVQRGIVRVN
jgi:nucleoside-diphosphate kinase